MGQKRKDIFKKFVEEKKNKLILNLTIWICLLMVALLIGLSDLRIMEILSAFGILLGYINMKDWLHYKKTMKKMNSLEKLYVQLEKVDTEQFTRLEKDGINIITV